MEKPFFVELQKLRRKKCKTKSLPFISTTSKKGWKHQKYRQKEKNYSDKTRKNELFQCAYGWQFQWVYKIFSLLKQTQKRLKEVEKRIARLEISSLNVKGIVNQNFKFPGAVENVHICADHTDLPCADKIPSSSDQRNCVHESSTSHETAGNIIPCNVFVHAGNVTPCRDRKYVSWMTAVLYLLKKNSALEKKIQQSLSRFTIKEDVRQCYKFKDVQNVFISGESIHSKNVGWYDMPTPYREEENRIESTYGERNLHSVTNDDNYSYDLVNIDDIDDGGILSGLFCTNSNPNPQSDKYLNMDKTTGKKWDVLGKTTGKKWDVLGKTTGKKWDVLGKTTGKKWDVLGKTTGKKWDVLGKTTGKKWDVLGKEKDEGIASNSNSFVNNAMKGSGISLQGTEGNVLKVLPSGDNSEGNSINRESPGADRDSSYCFQELESKENSSGKVTAEIGRHYCRLTESGQNSKEMHPSSEFLNSEPSSASVSNNEPYCVSKAEPCCVSIVDPFCVSNAETYCVTDGEPCRVSSGEPCIVSDNDPYCFSNDEPFCVPNAKPCYVSSVEPFCVSNVETYCVTDCEPCHVSNGEPCSVSNGKPCSVSDNDPSCFSNGEPFCVSKRKADPFYVSNSEPCFVPSVEPFCVSNAEPYCVTNGEPCYVSNDEPCGVPSSEPFCVSKDESSCVSKGDSYCVSNAEPCCVSKDEPCCVTKSESKQLISAQDSPSKIPPINPVTFQCLNIKNSFSVEANNATLSADKTPVSNQVCMGSATVTQKKFHHVCQASLGETAPVQANSGNRTSPSPAADGCMILGANYGLSKNEKSNRVQLDTESSEGYLPSQFDSCQKFYPARFPNDERAFCEVSTEGYDPKTVKDMKKYPRTAQPSGERKPIQASSESKYKTSVQSRIMYQRPDHEQYLLRSARNRKIPVQNSSEVNVTDPFLEFKENKVEFTARFNHHVSIGFRSCSPVQAIDEANEISLRSEIESTGHLCNGRKDVSSLNRHEMK